VSRRFLLIQLQHMGDVVLVTPAVRALREAEPDAVIHVLAGEAGAQALHGNPHADRVIPHHRRIGAFIAQLRSLRMARYDVAIDFHSVPRSALLVAATGAAMRVGVRGRGPRVLAYTHLMPRERTPVYMPRQKMQLLHVLGIDTGEADARPYIHVTSADREWAAQAWQQYGFHDGSVAVAVSAVSKLRHKQWGAERWAAVADGMLERGVRVVLTHGPGEAEQVAAVSRAMRGAAMVAHDVGSIARLAALYERCALWLGNDGGPKHIASAVGTPTVAIARRGVGPVWSDAHDPAQLWFDAEPPGGCDDRCDSCLHLGCLGATTVEQVLAAADVQLSRRRADGAAAAQAR
jgi:ADP-heptose:LPS heptosyltransferase